MGKGRTLIRAGLTKLQRTPPGWISRMYMNGVVPLWAEMTGAGHLCPPCLSNTRYELPWGRQELERRESLKLGQPLNEPPSESCPLTPLPKLVSKHFHGVGGGDWATHLQVHLEKEQSDERGTKRKPEAVLKMEIEEQF